VELRGESDPRQGAPCGSQQVGGFCQVHSLHTLSYAYSSIWLLGRKVLLNIVINIECASVI
jgi:hypothetical protein